MRTIPVLGALALVAITGSARAEEPAPAAPAAPGDDGVRAELARQAAAIEQLSASLEAERRVAERRQADKPPVVVSGFVQVDWVIHNQESQNEINGQGELLNLDRFTLRRGH